MDGTRGGAYQLLIRLHRRQRISVGKLGEFDFPAGYYVYTGSAMGGIEARVARHLRSSKRMRWHIDYLLERGTILRYASRVSSTRQECAANAAVLDISGAAVVARGFGSSDCGCAAHLVYFESEPPELPVEKLGELSADG